MNKFIKYLLVIILIALIFFVFNEPGPIWFFPFFIIIYLLKNPIRKIINLKNIKLPTKYILTGLIGGLFIELLAIIGTSKFPPEQRVLFNPEPIPDLILGIGYYTALMLGSYFTLKKYKFSLRQFFIIGGIFGLIAEEYGKVLLRLLGGDIVGGIYIFLSYGSFLALPYILFNENFNELNRKESKFIKYPIALLTLILSYGLFALYYTVINPLVNN